MRQLSVYSILRFVIQLFSVCAVVCVCGIAQSSSAEAPFAFTQPAFIVASTDCVLNGMVTPNEVATTAWFEWGADTSYGNTTATVDAGNGSCVNSVAATIHGLVPGQTYHFRLVASNSAGVAYGADQMIAFGKKVWIWGGSRTNVLNGASNSVTVAAGYSHGLALRIDGGVFAWGGNDYGQTNVPVNANNIVSVVAGWFHNLALKDDGTLIAWGRNSEGQTNVPVGLSNVAAISAGSHHNLVLRKDGTVFSWGSNYWGQTNVPAGLSNVVAIAACGQHSVALKNDGTLVAWGYGSAGQTNVPANVTNVMALAQGSSQNVVLKKDGMVTTWGYNQWGELNVPAGLSNVVAVAGGYEHSLALKNDGTLVSWGNNWNGVTNVPQGLSNVVTMAGGRGFSLALGPNSAPLAISNTISGSVNSDSIIALKATDANCDALFLRISSLPGSGVLYQYNGNGRGEAISANNTLVTDPSGRVIFVPASDDHGNPYASFQYTANDGTADSLPATVSIKIGFVPFVTIRPANPLSPTTAQLYGSVNPQALPTSAWFEWGYYDLTNKTPTVQVDAGTAPVTITNLLAGLFPGRAFHYRLVASNGVGVTYGLRRVFAEGKSVLAWGGNFVGQTNVPAGLNKVVAVAAGLNHNLALKSDRTVVAWGLNNSGQTNVPANLGTVIAIAAGGDHCLALKENGKVVAWGDSNGQTNVPAGLSNIVAVAAGRSHSLALKDNGRVVLWDPYSQGEVAGLSNVVAIAGGDSCSLALKDDGTVTAWGYYGSGAMQVPVGLSNVVDLAPGLAITSDKELVSWGFSYSPPVWNDITAISVGYQHRLALQGNGTVVAWGVNSYGQTTVPSGASNVVGVAAGEAHSLALIGRPAMDVPEVITQPAKLVNETTAELTGTILPGGLAARAWLEWGSSTNYGNAITMDLPPDTVTVTLTNLLSGLVPNQPWHYRVGASNAVGVVYGCDETVAVISPYVTTRPVIPVNNTNALLNGCTTPNGLPTKAWFEWGVDSSYGNRTEMFDAGSGSSVLTVTNLITGLVRGGTYHYRLVSSNFVGVAYGSEQIFGIAKTVSDYASHKSYPLPPNNSAVALADSGTDHCLLLKTDRTVAAWNPHSYPEIYTIDYKLTNVVALSGGVSHNLALRGNGTVYAWGDNAKGQTNVPAGLSNVVAVAAGASYSLALTENGNVVSWGTYGQDSVPAGASNVVAIAAGENYSVALKNNGSVITWGYVGGRATNLPIALSNVVAIAVGGRSGLALTANKEVYGWSYYAYSDYGHTNWGFRQSALPAGFGDIVFISAAGDRNAAIKNQGKVIRWSNDQVTSGYTNWGSSNIVAVSAGWSDLELVANSTPVVTSQTNNALLQSQQVVSLVASDLEMDPLSLRITALPSIGTLYQLNGAVIDSVNTVVTDFGCRVVYVPSTNAYSPQVSFEFVANDGLIDSNPAKVAFNITAYAPGISTHSATFITPTSAQLRGGVNPLGLRASAWIEWGTDTSYGERSEVFDAGSGNSTIMLTNQLTGLKPGSTYYYRWAATNLVGCRYGTGASFSTTLPTITAGNCVVNADGAFRLQCSATPGLTYSTWGSTNLIDWSRLGTAVELSPGNFEFTEADATNYPARFYQLRWP